MDLRNILWLLSLVLQFQDFICGASLGLENENESLSKQHEILENSNVHNLSFQGMQSKGPRETIRLRSSKRRPGHIIRKSPALKKKWDFKKLQTQYHINPDQSYRPVKGDTNPHDLRISVDGYKVKVVSAPKSRQISNTAKEGMKTGHLIEIVPVKETDSDDTDKDGMKTGHLIEIVPERETDLDEYEECEDEEETSNEDLGLKIDISESENLSDDEANLNSNLVNENIMGLNEEGSGSDSRSIHAEELIFDSGKDLKDGDTKENEISKSSRGIMDVFFRSNNSLTACKTPSGEPGHCKRMTECLLSDALSNFSLFLQYLCLMRGPFVGMCCPDNPVIETKDSDNSTDSVIEEFKQPEEGCGKNSNLRIVGGTISVPHEWTWMVALLRRNRFFCGGVIINNWYVLTAAHCVLGIKVKDLTVRLGEYNFSEKNEHQRDIPIAEIKRHAQFVTLTFQHDIALLKLKKKVEYSKFIGSICLPEPQEDYSQVNATVVGWGTVSFGGAASPILRQVKIPVWSNEECDKTYSLESITDSFMCAGSPENGEDACQGDSGGPLMVLNKERRWEVIGIVSWGRRCGDPTFPGVYTRVTTYLDWIQENIN